MFRNYLKLAFRNIVKHKAYSGINIFGLAIGITCCIFIFLYVFHEVSYDRYHPDHQRIFRVIEDVQTQTSNRIFAQISPPLAPAVKDLYSQVEYAARIVELGRRMVKHEDKVFHESNCYSVDQDVFHIFKIPFLRGEPAAALERPRTVVMTERMAFKYFGHDNPVGKLITINKVDYEITGIVADPPSNTHWKYDIITSLETYKESRWIYNWHSTAAYTYIKLAPHTIVENFETQISNIAEFYVSEELKTYGQSYHYFLQPLSDIHLYSNYRDEIEPPGNPQMIAIFFLVGIMVLLIASINFINLATAGSIKRAREVGMRKVVGARKEQLIFQFLGESIAAAFLSLIVSICIVALLMPFFNNFLGTSFSFSHLSKLPMIGVMLILFLFTGLAAGSYPAFVLSSFKPISIIRENRTRYSTKSPLRRILVLLQFSITIIFLIMTIGVHRQLKYMKNQDLGFDKEQKLVIPFQGGIRLTENYESVKNQFLEHADILNASASSSLPGRSMFNYATTLIGPEGELNHAMYYLYFDPEFIPNFHIKMIAGRSFEKEMSTDAEYTCLINRAALEPFGWSSPEQAIGQMIRSGNGNINLEILGVTENFHYRGLQHKVDPLIMSWFSRMFYNITLTVNTKNLDNTLAFVQKTWKRLYPGHPFEYYFLDEYFNKQYLYEERTGILFGLFTILGQLIACLGLLGLAAYMTQQRTHEIGVRKALGASVSNIIFLYSREFLQWVILANVIAWPAAYFTMNKWLSNFTFRTVIGIGIFVFSGLMVLLIAVLTVGYQSLRAASINPADALRFE